MIYLLIKNNYKASRTGTQDWVGLHKERDSAVNAYNSIELGPDEELALVEINPVEPTWTWIGSRYSGDHSLVHQLLEEAQEKMKLWSPPVPLTNSPALEDRVG